MKPENKYPALTAGLIQALRIDGTFPLRDQDHTPFNCGCGKGFTSLAALQQHQQALNHINGKKKRRAERQRRLRRAGMRKK